MSDRSQTDENLASLARRFVMAQKDYLDAEKARHMFETKVANCHEAVKQIADEMLKHVGTNVRERHFLVEDRIVRVRFQSGVDVVEVMKT